MYNLKKINNNIFYPIYYLIAFMLLQSCNFADMDSYVLSINDEDAVAAKGGYYYLEEEEDSKGKVAYPTMEYYQSTEWSEASYGTYLLHQDVSIKMNGSQITQTTTRVDASCSGRLHLCSYADNVLKDIENNNTGSSEVKFIRAKSNDLKKVDDEDGTYNKASFLFLFVNSVKSISGNGYDYDFATPVPFLLRSDLSTSAYQNKLAKDIVLQYNYTSTNPDDSSGSVTLTAHLESSNKSYIKIKVSNVLNDCGNANKQAERYGSFPFPKEIVYNINLKKDKKITKYVADTEALVTKNAKGSAAAYSQGNVAPTIVETKLCKYTLSGKTTSFSCGK